MAMLLLSTKLVSTHFDARHDYGGHPAHWCPACEELHSFAVERPFRNGARWTWDGNLDRPTFSPSMNIAVGPFPDGRVERCHYFLRNGEIQFCSDCSHHLAGQTVPLPDIPQSERLKCGAPT